MHVLNNSKYSLVAIFAVLTAVCHPAQGGLFTTIDISSIANANLQLTNTEFPSGLVTLGGVPFAIGTTGNNYYYSGPNDGLGFPYASTSANIAINLTGVTGVHTLINTAFGENGLGTLASLTFTYSDSSTFVKTLDGNSDIRDFYNNVFTNSINGTTTQNVFTTDTDGASGPNQYRLDKQFIDLSAFSAKTLVSMTLRDDGGAGIQRTFMSGVTAESITAVPEPSSFAMAVSAVVCFIFWQKRTTNRRQRAIAELDVAT